MKNRRKYVRVFSRHPSIKNIRYSITSPIYTVYRHGSVTECPNAQLEINTIQSVQYSKDKIKMKQLFFNEKVASPMFYTIAKEEDTVFMYPPEGYQFKQYSRFSPSIAQEFVRFPLLAKRKFRSRGNGMRFINDVDELLEFIDSSVNFSSNNPYYFEEYINYSREYRLHMSPLGCFYTCRKMLKSDAKNRWYRNDSNSVWILEENPNFNKPTTWDKIVEDCSRAREAVGLTLGAIDIIVAKDGRWQIIEINSAPSFGEITEIKYREEIEKIVNQYV